MSTIKQCVDALLDSSNSGLFDASLATWPPDAFAVAATLLKATGSYRAVLNTWPPRGEPHEWVNSIETSGRDWRAAAATGSVPPAAISERWGRVLGAGAIGLDDLPNRQELVGDLLELIAMADCACAGVGIDVAGEDNFLWKAAHTLSQSDSRTICSKKVSSVVAKVLPKQHTPSTGLTLRSLTHHLALHLGNEVVPTWHSIPLRSSTPHLGRPQPLNLLIAPWPLRMVPSQFRVAQGALANMPNDFGFMETALDQEPAAIALWISNLMAAARRTVGRIDGVVFPEAALTREGVDAVRAVVLANDAFLIAGVLSQLPGSSCPTNQVEFHCSLGGQPVLVSQHKHHRWKLDRTQVEMYGLAGQLDPNVTWWEHIQLRERRVHFLAMNRALTLCCLVCEDLARQDPVAELVRSVGPTLVIALLMDGPQLGNRWPARYATVLADDPGSSVLTVTGIGMATLSRPPPGKAPSRSVALWKDARSGLVEIELPPGAQGLALNIYFDSVTEWTADGRSDGGVGSIPRLGGIHPVST